MGVHVERLGKKEIAYKVLGGMKRALGISRRRCGSNIKLDLQVEVVKLWTEFIRRGPEAVILLVT
jgi:hypothetical protein